VALGAIPQLIKKEKLVKWIKIQKGKKIKTNCNTILFQIDKIGE